MVRASIYLIAALQNDPVRSLADNAEHLVFLHFLYYLPKVLSEFAGQAARCATCSGLPAAHWPGFFVLLHTRHETCEFPDFGTAYSHVLHSPIAASAVELEAL